MLLDEARRTAELFGTRRRARVSLRRSAQQQVNVAPTPCLGIYSGAFGVIDLFRLFKNFPGDV